MCVDSFPLLPPIFYCQDGRVFNDKLLLSVAADGLALADGSEEWGLRVRMNRPINQLLYGLAPLAHHLTGRV